MNKIDIQINQAKILSFSVELNDDKPEVSTTIGLFAGEKRVSTFSLRTQTFYSDSIAFELPLDMIDHIVEISKQLETILIRECNKQLKALPEPKE